MSPVKAKMPKLLTGRNERGVEPAKLCFKSRDLHRIVGGVQESTRKQAVRSLFCNLGGQIDPSLGPDRSTISLILYFDQTCYSVTG